MTVYPTEDKRAKFQRAAEGVLEKQWSTIREVAGLIGLMIAYMTAVQYGGAHIKILEKEKNDALKIRKGNFDGLMPVSDRARQEIEWWLDKIPSACREIKQAPELEVFTDASLEGWGAHRGDATAGGRWMESEQDFHINILELKAIKLGLQSLVREKGAHVRVLTDNTTALAYVRNMGGVKSEGCNEAAKEIWDWCEENENWVTIAHIPGVLNVTADHLSRHFADNIEWELSHKIFQKIIRIFGSPEVDLFASRRNKKVDTYVAWGPDPEAWKVDALSFEWTGAYFYMFPPFSLIGRVLRKIREDDADAVLVAPWWPTQAWFGTLLKATHRRLRFRRRAHNLIPQGNPRERELLGSCPLVVCRFLPKNC